MNENVFIYNENSNIKDIVKIINEQFTLISNAIDNASDNEYEIINKVLGWDDISKSLGMAIHDLINKTFLKINNPKKSR